MTHAPDDRTNAPLKGAEAARLRRAREAYAQGVEAAKNDRWKAALRAFTEAARLAPNEPRFNYVKGVALCRQDRFDEAIEAFHEELKIVPGHGPALAEIGTCLARTGRAKEGIDCLQKGLLKRPDLQLAHYSLGLALLTVNRRQEAIEALDRAITLDASHAEAYRTRGLALAMDGQFDRSMADLRASLALKNEDYGAILELGVDSGKASRNREAARLFELAADLAPNVAYAQHVYGQFLINNRQFEKGLRYTERAIELEPLRGDYYVARGFGFLGQGRVEEAVAAYRRAGELDPTNAGIAGTLLFALQHKPGVTKAEVLRAHKRWAELYRPSAAKDRFLFLNEPDPDRLPRLGIVSADLHRHAVAFLTLRAYEALTSLGYELFCYQTDQKRVEDDFTDRFKAISTWRDASGIDDYALAKQIAEDRIDILFDLAGHTAGNRMPVFARRAAPIQLSWAGYVGTIGLDTYDGLIADPVEVPPEDDEYYVEPVIRLPDCYVCYETPIDAEVAPLPSLGGGRFTFGCFNRPAKINEEVAKAWARILERVPDSRILMVYGGLDEAGTRQALHDLFGHGGLPVDRVELIGHGEQRKLVAAYGDVDIALDPFPYSAGVTTLEAMWMGVPTITYAGDTFAGRHSATHLTAAGLREFLMPDVDSYVAAAVSWSSRREELAELRRGLRARVERSPLCDAPRFANNLSDQLMRLWRDWCDGRRTREAG